MRTRNKRHTAGSQTMRTGETPATDQVRRPHAGRSFHERCLAGTLFCLTAVALHGASFSASLDRDTIALGETAVLNLVFEGSGQMQLSPPPAVPGLVISGPQQQQSTSIVNGQQTQSLTVSYYLRPTQTNTFTIPALSASIQGESFTSQPLTLRVIQATSSGVARLLVPKDRLYVGEPIVVEFQLLLSSQVRGLQEFALPVLGGDGWETGRVPEPQQRQTQMANDRITVLAYQVPLIPRQPGKLALGPVNTSMVVNVASPRQRTGDPFWDWDPFGTRVRTEPRRLPLTLPAHEVEVVPLPSENVPAGFGGAVGQFRMDVTVGPTNLAVGDPLTVRINITGHGNLGAVRLPDDLWRGDFKTYPPEKRLETTDPFGFAGVYSFEQVVVPENTEVRELPAVEFTCFNPSTGAYQTLRHPPTPLVVRPAGSTPAPLVTIATGETTPGATHTQLVHIKQRLGPPGTAPVTGRLPASFVLWNAVPVLAFVGTVAWRKRRESLDRNPKLRRKQEAQRFVTQSLQKLREHVEAGEGPEFFGLLFRVLQEQLGATFDQSSSGITEAVIEERLRGGKLSEEATAALRDLFQACNQALYAPVQDRQELAALLEKLETAQRGLKEVKG